MPLSALRSSRRTIGQSRRTVCKGPSPAQPDSDLTKVTGSFVMKNMTNDPVTFVRLRREMP